MCSSNRDKEGLLNHTPLKTHAGPSSSRVSLWLLAFSTFFLALPASVRGQEQGGVNEGNYNIKQSIEFGYRFVSNSGDQNTYDTMINLSQGFRLLDFSTEMTSLDHHGAFFDRLFFYNSGYGGDPQNASRLQIAKHGWYDFSAQFRRDENTFNYSLLANPLNPTTPAFANAPAGFTPVISSSPHLYNTRRKMQDYDLLLLPQSRVRFRVGYSRNSDEGPELSTIHLGTEQLLFTNVATVQDTYRLGVDFRLLPHTNISYDQPFTYYKDDSGYFDQNQLFPLANGVPVDIGVALNAGASQPCANTFLPTGFVNPVCNAVFNYTNSGRTRTYAPTEQLALQSSYFPRLDLSARVSYSQGSEKLQGWTENWDGLETKPTSRIQQANGSVFGERVAASADFGATLHLTNSLDFVDSFHYSNFHNPVEFDSNTCLFFAPDLLTAPNVFSPFTPNYPCNTPAGTNPGTPVHNTNSDPDFVFNINSGFLKQAEKTNLAQLQYQISSRFGVRVGFRDRHREIDQTTFDAAMELFLPNNANRGDCALVSGALPVGCTANGDGSFTFVAPNPTVGSPGEVHINEYSGLFGVWVKPIPNWRISFDMELKSADNVYTRIDPRQAQEYRLRTKYKPSPWFNLDGSITIWEARNNVPNIENLQHNRVYSFSAIFLPRESLTFELGYSYSDIFSNILICYTSSAAPPGLSNCPGSTKLIQQPSIYTDNSHFGNFDVDWHPWKRLRAKLGANLTGTSGSVLIISPNAPSGPLDSKFLQPYGGIDYLFTNHWTGKAYWAYHGYHEDVDAAVVQDVFAPRNFHANLVTLSVRYAF
jgi:hypothetical protein